MGEHEYVYISEIKVEKKKHSVKNGGQNNLCHMAPKCKFMLINVKVAQPISFLPQKMRN